MGDGDVSEIAQQRAPWERAATATVLKFSERAVRSYKGFSHEVPSNRGALKVKGSMTLQAFTLS